MDYALIKKNYERKLWSLSAVKMAVEKGVITSDEYKDITGEDYVSK